MDLYFLSYRIVIRIRKKVVKAHMEKMALLEKKRKRLEVDPESLRWSPLIVTGSAILEEEKEAKREVRIIIYVTF